MSDTNNRIFQVGMTTITEALQRLGSDRELRRYDDIRDIVYVPGAKGAILDRKLRNPNDEVLAHLYGPSRAGQGFSTFSAGAVLADFPVEKPGDLGRSILERRHRLDALLLFAEELVGDVHRGQDRHPRRRGHRRIAGDLVHALVHESGDLLDVFGVGSTLEGVLLAEDGDCDALLFQKGTASRYRSAASGEQDPVRLTEALQLLEKSSDLVLDFLPLLFVLFDGAGAAAGGIVRLLEIGRQAIVGGLEFRERGFQFPAPLAKPGVVGLQFLDQADRLDDLGFENVQIAVHLVFRHSWDGSASVS